MEILKKFKSRKFLASVAGMVMGAVMALGVSADELETVLGAAVSVVSLVSYIAAEGKIDAEAIARAASAAESAVRDVSEG